MSEQRRNSGVAQWVERASGFVLSKPRRITVRIDLNVVVLARGQKKRRATKMHSTIVGIVLLPAFSTSSSLPTRDLQASRGKV